MLWGAHLGALELRAEGGETRLRATFPYGQETELTAGRSEVFAPRAFAARLAGTGDIHLLIGHDYDRPLASRASGSLTLRDGDDALHLVARVSDATSWARDFLGAHAAGLIRFLSPGFKVAPGGDAVERRGAGLLRRVMAAELFEVSVVTVPAYPIAQVEARSWQAGVARTLARWRV